MFFRKKIKESKTKPGMYGNKYNDSGTSMFSELSIIEKFVLIGGPALLVFVTYTILGQTLLTMWLKLVISITAVGLLIMLLILIIHLLTGMD